MNIQFGLKVKRVSSDYTNNRIGNIIGIDWDKKRVRVDWAGFSKTWVSFNSIVEAPLTPAEQLEGLIMQKVLAEVNNYFVVFLRIAFSKDQTFNVFFSELKEQQTTNPELIEKMIGREAAELLKTIQL